MGDLGRPRRTASRTEGWGHPTGYKRTWPTPHTGQGSPRHWSVSGSRLEPMPPAWLPLQPLLGVIWQCGQIQIRIPCDCEENRHPCARRSRGVNRLNLTWCLLTICREEEERNIKHDLTMVEENIRGRLHHKCLRGIIRPVQLDSFQ